MFRPFKLLRQGQLLRQFHLNFTRDPGEKAEINDVTNFFAKRRGERLAIVPLPWYFCLLDGGDLKGSTFLRTSAMGETSGMNPVGSTGMSFMASPQTSGGVVNVIGRDVVEAVVKV